MMKWGISESCSEEIISMFEVYLVAICNVFRFIVSLIMWYKKNKLETVTCHYLTLEVFC